MQNAPGKCINIQFICSLSVFDRDTLSLELNKKQRKKKYASSQILQEKNTCGAMFRIENATTTEIIIIMQKSPLGW